LPTQSCRATATAWRSAPSKSSIAEAGEFRVDIDQGTTGELWGGYWQVVVVDPPGTSRQTWRGDVVLEAQR